MKNLTKKVFLVLVLLSFISVNAYAAQITSASGQLDIFSSTNVVVDTANNIDDTQDPIGMSPKVEANYNSDDASTGSTDSQWYSIATVHPGGNRVYGTAQDVNNVYFQDHETGTDLQTSLDKVPTNPQSASVWGTQNWEL